MQRLRKPSQQKIFALHHRRDFKRVACYYHNFFTIGCFIRDEYLFVHWNQNMFTSTLRVVQKNLTSFGHNCSWKSSEYVAASSNKHYRLRLFCTPLDSRPIKITGFTSYAMATMLFDGISLMDFLSPARKRWKFLRSLQSQ